MGVTSYSRRYSATTFHICMYCIYVPFLRGEDYKIPIQFFKTYYLNEKKSLKKKTT